MADIASTGKSVGKNIGIAFLLLLLAGFVTSGESAEEQEAERLGFSSASDMEMAHEKGWHTNAQYMADEAARAERFGFADIQEMHRADEVGARTQADYDRYLRDNEREEELASVNQSEEIATSGETQISLPRMAFACGGGGYRNGRLVFDPERNKVYLGSVVGMRDGTGGRWESALIRKEGSNWYFLFQGTLENPTQEVYFYPDQLRTRENSNYEPGGKERSDRCYARIDRVRRECATAGDIDKCMEILDRGAWAANLGGSCSITAPRWLEFQCDDITQNYQNTLNEVRSFNLYDF